LFLGLLQRLRGLMKPSGCVCICFLVCYRGCVVWRNHQAVSVFVRWSVTEAAWSDDTIRLCLYLFLGLLQRLRGLMIPPGCVCICSLVCYRGCVVWWNHQAVSVFVCWSDSEAAWSDDTIKLCLYLFVGLIQRLRGLLIPSGCVCICSLVCYSGCVVWWNHQAVSVLVRWSDSEAAWSDETIKLCLYLFLGLLQRLRGLMIPSSCVCICLLVWFRGCVVWWNHQAVSVLVRWSDSEAAWSDETIKLCLYLFLGLLQRLRGLMIPSSCVCTCSLVCCRLITDLFMILPMYTPRLSLTSSAPYCEFLKHRFVVAETVWICVFKMWIDWTLMVESLTSATIDLFSLRKLIPQPWFGCLAVS